METTSNSPFQMHKTGNVISRDTIGSNFNHQNYSPVQKTETIQLDRLSVDQRDRFSRIVFDEDDAEVTSIIAKDRIKI